MMCLDSATFMLSYKMDFSFCACKPDFVKSSHIFCRYDILAPYFVAVMHLMVVLVVLVLLNF